jgi:hypothetical protein
MSWKVKKEKGRNHTGEMLSLVCNMPSEGYLKHTWMEWARRL